MKFKKILTAILSLVCIIAILTSCGVVIDDPVQTDENGNEIIQTDKNGETVKNKNTNKNTNNTNNNNNNNNNNTNKIPDEEITGVGENLNHTGINNGKFEGDTTSADFTVTYVSGTQGAYKYDDATKTLTFTTLSTDSVYAISGKLNGNIIIDVGETYKLDLELTDFSLRSSKSNPIFANSGNEIKITAKKDTKNYIYDERTAVDTTQTGVYGGSIHSIVDLEICGRGELFIQSQNNNGIQVIRQ